MVEVEPNHHRNIPYGCLCHEAADLIEKLQAKLKDATLECEIKGSCLGRVNHYAVKDGYNGELSDYVAVLFSERDDLKAWMGGAMQVFDELDLEAVGQELGVPIGCSVAQSLLPEIRRLKADKAGMESERDTYKRAVENARKERDDARDELDEWHDAAKHVDSDHPDEVHCGCVPVLRKQLKDARAESARLQAQLTESRQKVTCLNAKLNRQQTRELEVLRAGNRHLAEAQNAANRSQQRMVRLLNAITEAVREMEKCPDDSTQAIWNESLESWETGLRMNHLLELEPNAPTVPTAGLTTTDS
jgi:hypothetical protein